MNLINFNKFKKEQTILNYKVKKIKNIFKLSIFSLNKIKIIYK